MATAVKRLGFSTLRCTYRSIPQKRPRPPLRPFRSFTSTISHRDDEEDRPSKYSRPSEPSKPTTFAASLHPDDSVFYDSLSPEDRLEYERNAREIEEYMKSPRVESEMSAEVSIAVQEVLREFPDIEEQEPKPRPGLLSMSEVDEFEQEEDPVWKNDDITSLAHGELEQHRELRTYARIAAWEMPLLSKFAKPFTPPGADAPLRFRYTTYMGESHPASSKIVVEFCTHDLPTLTPLQRLKLIKLVGVRYNPSTDIIKMSCEMFPNQAQNKRYLGDLIDTLIAEAQDPTDTFADVPLDFRHHKWKRKLEFPEAWKLTEGRKKQLEADRAKRAEEERERLESGRLVHGVRVIEEVLQVMPAVQEKAAVAAPVGKAKAKAKRPKRLL